MPMRPPIHRPAGTSAQRIKLDRERGSPDARGYDYAWKKVRLAKLKADPLCADCQRRGRVTPATEVHHVLRIADRPDLRLDEANLAALCQGCHAIRTRRGE